MFDVPANKTGKTRIRDITPAGIEFQRLDRSDINEQEQVPECTCSRQ
jgi:hypothetical protein